jgi:integrase
VTAKSLLALYQDQPDRINGDRLEILTALINAPSFDPLFRSEVIHIPRGHPAYRWDCVVSDCQRARSGGADLCPAHHKQWRRERDQGMDRLAFLHAAQPLGPTEWVEEGTCRLCPQRPSTAHLDLRLCGRHLAHWNFYRRTTRTIAPFEQWVTEQETDTGYGPCRVTVCLSLADSPLGLCARHQGRYQQLGRPGGAALPKTWWQRFARHGLPVPVSYQNREHFDRWCATAAPLTWPGQVNLRGLRPLLRAEFQWTMFVHPQRPRPSRWDPTWLQRLANLCRDHNVNSLVDLDLADIPHFSAAIARTMLHELRLVYYTPSDTREAGFIETDHFGRRFNQRGSHIDLTAISQRWLRNLLWDYLANLMRSQGCPRSNNHVDEVRRACTELSVFLAVDAPAAGEDPTMLRAEHMHRFIADQRRRERDGLPSIVMINRDGNPSVVTTNTRCHVFNGSRRLLRDALESGAADGLGLGREFIVAMPTAKTERSRTRRPFPDEVARALADETNLARLAGTHDPDDHGMRDIWETIVTTGRRTSEVVTLRWDCIGHYGTLPMFWHDQTKVGNYDTAIRIPERLYEILAERQRKTLHRFTTKHGHPPTTAQQAGLALFPSRNRNPDGTNSVSYKWFHTRFRQWVDELNLGRPVPHQARHSLATNLLRHGATLTHIRRYLGHVSDRMAEHYIHLTHSDLEDVLQQVWVTGPGTANPGELLTDTAPMTREQAQALAIDLSRRSTPAEGGFCTFQPVVDGGACPWNLNCHSCDKFVLSGADLLYWRRKREQWRQLAEGAPDDATADYLHAYFEPTARAIDGLEKALAGLGLLDDALALDLRKPQDYFQRVWATAFRAADLAAAADNEDGTTTEDSGEDRA